MHNFGYRCTRRVHNTLAPIGGGPGVKWAGKPPRVESAGIGGSVPRGSLGHAASHSFLNVMQIVRCTGEF